MTDDYRDQTTEHDRALIANVLARVPNSWPPTARSLALGAVCPYPATAKRLRAAWCAEIDRQEAEERWTEMAPQ